MSRRVVIFARAPFPVLSANRGELPRGGGFDFLKGIGSDGYAGGGCMIALSFVHVYGDVVSILHACREGSRLSDV